MSFYREQLESYLKTLDVKANRVLDVGGAQLPIKDRVKSWDVQEYKILDLEQPHKGEKPDFICDLNEEYVDDGYRGPIVNSPNNWQCNDFDIVFCLEVMEYIWNPVAALTNLNHLMKKGGTLYISFPFVYMQHPPLGQDMLRYTPDGAERLLKKSGFKILEHIPRLGNNLLTQFYVQDKMRGVKGINHNVTGSIIKAEKL